MKKGNFSAAANLADEAVSLAGEIVYPHLKITREDFPRLLVTRKIADDDADYFGAFLPATGVRFWLEFIARTFRLRTCEIEIDGAFPAPCPEFYAKRCVAPCVESLCDRENYLEQVALVRLFLSNEREKLLEILNRKIEAAAGELNFETAARWRDALRETEKVFAARDWNLWLADAVDTFETERRDSALFVYLVTQRGRKTLGKKVFVFDTKAGEAEVLGAVVRQFYRFHAPAEIRVPIDFPHRKQILKTLGERENRKIKFTVFGAANERKTSLQALKRARFDFDFRRIKPPASAEEIAAELKNLFALARPPRRVECFDAAHISASDLTAAKVVWENGEFLTGENEFWLSDEKSELAALGQAVAERFSVSPKNHPDLLLIDGGRSQLAAALQATQIIKNRKFQIVCAVKPPHRHAEISHFLTETGARVEFSGESEAMRLLLKLRDEAHDLANRVHRQRRDTAHFYALASVLPSLDERARRGLLRKLGSLKNLAEATEDDLRRHLPREAARAAFRDLETNRRNLFAAVKPVIVPLRCDDPNGAARDLQPLPYRKI